MNSGEIRFGQSLRICRQISLIVPTAVYTALHKYNFQYI